MNFFATLITLFDKPMTSFERLCAALAFALGTVSILLGAIGLFTGCNGRFTPRILQTVGLRSPLSIHPLQAMVSEPMKPWLDPIIVSGSLHVYVSQTARGELVMGASLDPYELHSTRSTLES